MRSPYFDLERMLMARKSFVISDLTGQIIQDEEHVSIKVLDHPTLQQPVRLDASEGDIKSLAGTSSDFAVIEILRQGSSPERMVVELTKFEKLFKVDAQEALEGAERVSDDGGPRRRGRRPGSGAAAKPKSDKIDYSDVQHAGIPHRGRITENEKATVRANLDTINLRLANAGVRTIEGPELSEKYGLLKS